MMRTYYRFLSLIVILVLICLKSIAQEKTDLKKLFIEAESYFLFEEYSDALPLYQKIVRVELENYNVQFKIGVCYLNDIYLTAKSLKYLEQASQNVNLNYKQNNFREKMAPLEAYYYLGRAYHVNNMLDKAIKSYRHFKSLAKYEEFDIEMVDEDIEACQFAKKILEEPVYFSPVNIKIPVNTRFEEKNPVISGDGNTLIFTRKLQFYNGVFISKRNNNGAWSEPVNLTSDFGLDGDSYACGISYSGDEIFVYRSDNFDGNIYSSKLISDKWNVLVKLNANINSRFWESHASLSSDGGYLYFTSNRSGGYGGLDIYKSKLSPKGDWGPAINLGPVINSPNNEDTPFLSHEGHYLFFSSEGHQTMGGYDVFVSTMKSDGTWRKPKNMGSPLNTTADDLFYNPLGVNSFGYLALYDESSTYGMLDIYEIEIYNDLLLRTFEVHGQLNVSDADAKFYKAISVKMLDADTKEVISESKVEDDGSFSISATQGEYLLIVEGTGIETYRKNLKLSIAQSSALVTLPAIQLERSSIIVVPIAVSSKEKITAENDFFAVNDSSIVSINLIIPRGSDLDVAISVNGNPISTESFESVKKRFTYLYKPKPGENILIFTATTPEGEISSTIVNVTYYTPPESETVSDLNEIEPAVSIFGSSFALISDGALQRYLKKIEMDDFENYSDLYSHLIGVSEQEGFTRADVNQMYSIYFSQKDMYLFDSDFKEVYSERDSNWNAVFDSSSIPLTYIKTLYQEGLISKKDMQNALLELLSGVFSDANVLYAYLSGFQKDSNDMQSDDSDYLLQLASTTEDLQFFYQNLLLVSYGELNSYLAGMQFESMEIKNSLDLLNHLFEVVDDQNFSYEEVIEALEKSSLNRRYYLNLFKEILAENANGSLKSQLLLLDLEENQINTYESLLKYLVEQSQYKNYSRAEVYKLLLDMIGITEVNEFSEIINSYNTNSVNEALADTALKYFSNPFEIVQFLLAATHDYDFSESDINNLLIRMILERGLSDRINMKHDNEGGGFWKNKKVLSAIILVNVVILILIILIIIRRKKR